MTDGNFATFLTTELSKRQSTNASYSLRAFARDLNIEPSLLSKILRKKIPITLKMLERLAPVAGLQEPDLKIYRDHVKSSESLKSFDHLKDKKIRYDEFKIIHDWYHVTLVELTLLSDFEASKTWIAHKLGINESEAELALEHLLNAGFVERAEDGHFKKSDKVNPNYKISANDKPANIKALRHMLHQYSDKAIVGVNQIPRTDRTHTARTVAIDSKLLDEAKEHISTFTQTLMDELEKKSSTKNHIYELMVSFFPLTKD